jgi:uncharacterized protein
MKITIAVLVVFAAAAVAGVAQPQFAHSAAAAGQTITVTGTGSVETVPDRATFFFSVTSSAESAKAALAKNEAAADAVVAALKSGAKVQTSGLSVEPRLDDKGATIVGYTASTTVTADAELAKIGGLIDAAVAAGADTVSGPSFSRSDREALYRAALKDAVAEARTKAAALAEAAGSALGEVKSLTEGDQSFQPIPLAGDMAAAKLEPGTQTIEATVTVTYAAG